MGKVLASILGVIMGMGRFDLQWDREEQKQHTDRKEDNSQALALAVG